MVWSIKHARAAPIRCCRRAGRASSEPELHGERRYEGRRAWIRDSGVERMFCLSELTVIVFGILMMVLGVFTLVNGSFRISRERVVWGVPARIIGALLIMPLFVCFGTLMAVVFVYQLQDRQMEVEEARKVGLILLGIDLAFILVILAIGLVTAEPVEAEKPPGDGEYEGDDVTRSGD